MTRQAPEVAILQTTLPDYRREFVAELDRRLAGGLVVLAGDDFFDPSVRTRAADGRVHVRVRNHYFLGRRLLWQAGCWRTVLDARVAVIEANPRILSSWLMLALRRALGRRTLLWGHVWSRSRRNGIGRRLRHLMRALGSGLIAYTETEAGLLRAEHAQPVTAAPNALYRHDEMGAGARQPGADGQFICVGRLVAEKKPAVLLEAFIACASDLGERTLAFVGDGPLRGDLESRAAAAGVGDRVVFTGHLADPAALRGLYHGAVASVSPGATGLSMIQSLAFGVPMIYSRDERHGPEIEAGVIGWNCLTFDSPD